MKTMMVAVLRFTVAITVLFTIFVLNAAHALAQSTLPPEKQAIQQLYDDERAAGAQNPAPRNPNDPLPIVADAPLDRGIIDDPDGPFSSQQLRVVNRWQGLINGMETVVYAGSQAPDDGGGGLVITITDLPDGPSQVSIPAPVAGGALRIVSDLGGGILKLVSSTGFYVMQLDLGSSMFDSVIVDQTGPTIAGMPAVGCSIWPPNKQLVQVASITANDTGAGLVPGSLTVTAISSEPSTGQPDIVIANDQNGAVDVFLRADRLGQGNGRTYTVTARAIDFVGNTTNVSATCLVPHDQR